MNTVLNENLEKNRSYYFDNLKFVLIVFVVVGHVIEPLIGSYSNIKLIYSFIYSFHMPLFVFISGYFSKGIINNKKIYFKTSGLLITYIIFQTIYSLFDVYILKTPNSKVTLVYPYWAMWYLLSLFIWDIMSPYFLRIKHPILIALFISLLCGYDNNVGYYLSLSRTIVFFPYFLMGYFCKKSYISTIKKYVRKKYAIVGVLSVLLILYMMNSVIDYRWFYGSYSYSQLSSLSYPKYFMRMATYIMAVTISIFILTLIPGKKLFFTKLGSRTMAVYVFHGFIVKELVKYNFFDHVGSLPSKVFIIIFSLFIVIVLSSKFMNKITKMISNPPFFNQINPTKI